MANAVAAMGSGFAGGRSSALVWRIKIDTPNKANACQNW